MVSLERVANVASIVTEQELENDEELKNMRIGDNKLML